MASGFDGRFAIAKESTYGTRAAPSRFLPLTSEDNNYTFNRYRSPALGTGMWGGASIITSQSGSGSISGDVTTTGMGILLDGLHANTVTPVQDGATTSYTQTHTLNTAPSKSFSVQVQMPPVTSSTLLPHDMYGVMFGGITFNWSGAGVLSYEIPTVVRQLDLTQANETYAAPAAYDLFSFKQGTLTIGGVAETNVLGDGSFAVEYPLRDDAFALGTNGLIAKPVLTDKPSASGTFTADFNDNANVLRTVNNTIADCVLTFEGATIASTFKYTLQITIPDCVFTTQRPTLGDAGPVQSTITFTAASSTADPPVIVYRSIDTAL